MAYFKHLPSLMARFLLMGEEGMACSLAWRMAELEGEEVAMCISDLASNEHLKGMVKNIHSVKNALSWVGKRGYVIADDEADMTRFRQAGYRCYGGNAVTCKMEKDRVYQSKLAQEAGVPVPNFHAVKNVDEAIAFVKTHPDAWCLKQLGHAPKEWNFVGKDDTGEDVLLQLEWIKKHPMFKKLGGNIPFMLQERVDGLEFAVGAWWIGSDWLRRDDGTVLTELNREHKKMLHGDLGVASGEMGTVLQFTRNTKLFEMFLEPLTPLLTEQCRDVVLNIDANCGLVNAREAYLYEYTPRMGYPAHTLHEALLETPSSQFYAQIIDGKTGEVPHFDGWCVGTVVGAGDFPHESLEDHDHTFAGQPVDAHWDSHTLPEYVRQDETGIYRIADDYPWVATVTRCGTDISAANALCVADMAKIDVRSPVYRTDIGEKFQKEELPQLVKWGYV